MSNVPIESNRQQGLSIGAVVGIFGISALLLAVVLGVIGSLVWQNLEFASEQATKPLEAVQPASTEAGASSANSTFAQTNPLPAGRIAGSTAPESSSSRVALGEVALSLKDGIFRIESSNREIQAIVPRLGLPHYWMAVLNNPRAKLTLFNGTPFFEAHKELNLFPSTEVVSLLDKRGVPALPGRSDIQLSPFFSAKATTLCIVEGFYNVQTFEGGLALYFVDTRSAAVVRILTSEPALPHWLSEEFPPPYSTEKFLRLAGQPIAGLGANVVAEVRRFEGGRYVDDGARFLSIAEQELQRAKLGRVELEQLKRTDILNAQMAIEAQPLISKFISLLYYGKRLGKQSALQVLVQEVHPSLRRSVAMTKELDLNPPASRWTGEP